ncbi:hypothetical protein B0H17DRAFT_103045 [Mycena rosella]|uniref:Uncharacterized protein n=1 Tax=Mycena rosella TaxID=1033263 RepID=A0AAD7D643_MYCRO|nr:hypothetical protein B0H17DRAFT_103045 [Mycena rosella]
MYLLEACEAAKNRFLATSPTSTEQAHPSIVTLAILPIRPRPPALIPAERGRPKTRRAPTGRPRWRNLQLAFVGSAVEDRGDFAFADSGSVQIIRHTDFNRTKHRSTSTEYDVRLGPVTPCVICVVCAASTKHNPQRVYIHPHHTKIGPSLTPTPWCRCTLRFSISISHPALILSLSIPAHHPSNPSRVSVRTRRLCMHAASPVPVCAAAQLSTPNLLHRLIIAGPHDHSVRSCSPPPALVCLARNA